MKTKKAEETHDAIVEAAKELFMEKSVNKVSVSEIVKKAGVAKGTFYLYFETKEALVWHFIDHELAQGNQWVEKIGIHGYTEEEIQRMVEFIMGFTKKHLKVLKMMHNVKFFSYLGFDSMQANYLEKWVEPFSQWLEKGRMLGELDITDSLFMAHYLISTIHEMIDRVILEDIPFTLDELELHLKVLLVKLLK